MTDSSVGVCMEISPQIINLQRELNYLDEIKIYLIFSDFDMTPIIDPPITLHTHPKVGVSPQIRNIQTELNYLD